MGLSGVASRRIGMGLGAVAAALVVAVLGAGWYYAGEIEDGALKVEHEPDEYDVAVVALGAGRITLRGPEDTDPRSHPGTVGLEWPGGYARVGGIAEVRGLDAVRAYAPVEGALTVGDLVRYDSFAFPQDPGRAHGMAFQEVRFASPLGELAAWYVDGTGDTWVILVHGKSADRGEALRTLPVVQAAGLPALVITYRNDEAAPRDPSGNHQFGATEWEDLDAAARYALDHGAADLIVVGYSMGGAIVASFLYESPLAGRVAGAILDSPMLDLGAAVDLGGRNRGLPQFLTDVAKVISSVRFGIDWEAFDHLARTDELSPPILLFHGDADATVPVQTSEALAESRRDIVTYLPFPGARHVGAWNIDPERYNAAVREFIERVAR